jgi:hypothetical protein
MRNLSLRFLNLLTGEALKVILDLKFLEGLDISGCFGIDLGTLSRLRGNIILKCLLLEYLLVRCDHIRNLADSKVHTLSLFCKQSVLHISFSIDSKTVDKTHFEVLKEVPSITHLNVQDCP